MKATCNSLRLYETREAFAILGIDCFSHSELCTGKTL